MDAYLVLVCTDDTLPHPIIDQEALKRRHVHFDLAVIDFSNAAAKTLSAMEEIVDSHNQIIIDKCASLDGAQDRSYKNVSKEDKVIEDEMMKVWHNRISPALKTGKNVLVIASQFPLRLYIGLLDKLDKDDLSKVNIPSGIPLIYELTNEFSVIKKYYLANLELQQEISKYNYSEPITEILTVENEQPFRYLIEGRLGLGSTGYVFSAIDQSNNKRVAVKFATLSPLEYQNEIDVYEKGLLADTTHAPKLYWHGKVKVFNVLIVELLDCSVEQIFSDVYKKKVTIDWIMDVAAQALEAIKWFHEKGYVHCSIKPPNLMYRMETKTLCLIDFGKSEKYLTENGDHVDEPKELLPPKTARYASLKTLLGQADSRRDDMESLAYSLIEFYKGSLPWQPFDGTDNVANLQRLKELKSQDARTICGEAPEVLVNFLTYTRNLRFKERPDYEKWKDIFMKETNKQRKL